MHTASNMPCYGLDGKEFDMIVPVHLGSRSYPIYIEPHAIDHLSDYLPERRYAIITDDGVPSQWVEKVSAQLPDSFVITIPQGEGSKSFPVYESVLKEMARHSMSRKDAVLALGGGVPGDLAGFAAATYMRGIDFYNIPTTVLSQVDSSVGGKTAIDLGEMKNIVGAFWQPKCVIIDPQVLSTLPDRQISNGLAEALKMGLIFDAELVNAFEADHLDITDAIARSIALKAQVVEADEKEGGLRKVLNFGHTIGHAIEGSYGLNTYLHGECVAMGMLYMIEDEALKQRVRKILDALHLPVIPADLDSERVMALLRHDKKGTRSGVDVIVVSQAGQYEIRHETYEQIEARLNGTSTPADCL